MAQFDLQEQLQALQDVANYDFEHDHDIPSMDGRAITTLLEGAVEAIADSSDAITDPEVFDAFRSLLKHAEHLQGVTMNKILDSISSGLQAQVDATSDLDDSQALQEHKAPLEMFAFLLSWFVTATEKVKSSGDEEAPSAPPARARRGRGGGKATSTRAAAKQADGWTWEDQIPGTLAMINKLLRLKTQKIWTTTVDRDTFIRCVLFEISATLYLLFL